MNEQCFDQQKEIKRIKDALGLLKNARVESLTQDQKLMMTAAIRCLEKCLNKYPKPTETLGEFLTGLKGGSWNF